MLSSRTAKLGAFGRLDRSEVTSAWRWPSVSTIPNPSDSEPGSIPSTRTAPPLAVTAASNSAWAMSALVATFCTSSWSSSASAQVHGHLGVAARERLLVLRRYARELRSTRSMPAFSSASSTASSASGGVVRCPLVAVVRVVLGAGADGDLHQLVFVVGLFVDDDEPSCDRRPSRRCPRRRGCRCSSRRSSGSRATVRFGCRSCPRRGRACRRGRCPRRGPLRRPRLRSRRCRA